MELLWRDKTHINIRLRLNDDFKNMVPMSIRTFICFIKLTGRLVSVCGIICLME